jgi:WXXGXW repeat (2 copies)
MIAQEEMKVLTTKLSIRSLLFALIMLITPVASFAQIGISVSFAPPELPVYEQPVCPGDGYIWTPGYWAWDNDGDDYYWVPGTWVEAPEVGYLWTPGYWGWGGSGFVFYQGYWGSPGRFLWRDQLWLRLFRPRLRRRPLGP